MSYWQCGDCGQQYSDEITQCNYALDDYLGLRGINTIEEAMVLRLAPIIAKFDRQSTTKYSYKFIGSQIYAA